MWALARRLRPQAVGHFEVLADPLEVGRREEVQAELTIHYREDVGARIEVGLVCVSATTIPSTEARTASPPSSSGPARRSPSRAGCRHGGPRSDRRSFRIPPNAPYSHEGGALSFAWRVSRPRARPRGRGGRQQRSDLGAAVRLWRRLRAARAAPRATRARAATGAGALRAGRHRSGGCSTAGRARSRCHSTSTSAAPNTRRPRSRSPLGRRSRRGPDARETPVRDQVPDDAPPTLEGRHGGAVVDARREGRRARGPCRSSAGGGDSILRHRPRIRRRRRSRSWSASTALSGASSGTFDRREQTPGASQDVDAVVGDCQRVGSPVLGVATALDEPLALEARPSARPSSFGRRPASPRACCDIAPVDWRTLRTAYSLM